MRRSPAWGTPFFLQSFHFLVSGDLSVLVNPVLRLIVMTDSDVEAIVWRRSDRVSDLDAYLGQIGRRVEHRSNLFDGPERGELPYVERLYSVREMVLRCAGCTSAIRWLLESSQVTPNFEIPEERMLQRMISPKIV